MAAPCPGQTWISDQVQQWGQPKATWPAASRQLVATAALNVAVVRKLSLFVAIGLGCLVITWRYLRASQWART